MVHMKAIDGIRVVAWLCLLIGFCLIVWQAKSGHGSDWLFNTGVAAMIGGSVLRVYAKYKRGNHRSAMQREPSEDSKSR
jgi:hypothetical protein